MSDTGEVELRVAPARHDEGDSFNEVKEILDAALRRLSRGEAVDEAMRALISGLGAVRAAAPGLEWARLCRTVCASHPVAKLLMQDPVTLRAAQKPRGYPGDAQTLDLLYFEEAALPEDTSPLGRELFAAIVRSAIASGVRSRRYALTRLIDELAVRHAGLRAWSIACGHLRELDSAQALDHGRVHAFHAIDHDPITIDVDRKRFVGTPVQARLASVADVLRDRYRAGEVDLVYAVGLFDYLSPTVARRLLGKMVAALAPGGTLFVANASTGSPDAGYMEAFMDWWLCYRSAAEMRALIAPEVAAQLEHLTIEIDSTGTFYYLQAEKRR